MKEAAAKAMEDKAEAAAELKDKDAQIEMKTVQVDNLSNSSRQAHDLLSSQAVVMGKQDLLIKGQTTLMIQQGKLITTQTNDMNNLTTTLAMPANPIDLEGLSVMKADDKLVAIRRVGRGMVARKKQLAAMGWKPVGHVGTLPNSRYLWKRLLAVLTSSGKVRTIMDHDQQSGRNTRCYKLAGSINLKQIVKQMCLTNPQECQWVEGMLDGRCGQNSIDQYMVPTLM